MYPKLAGMTGTALTEATEFGEIYRLEVVEIPTNVPVARKDADDEIYRTLADKSHFIYIGILALLIYVLLFGAVRGGSRRCACEGQGTVP